MTSAPYLPLDLQYMIIGALGDDGDHETLNVCSLVCRALVPAARRAVFASGVLTLNNQSRDGVSMARSAFERLLARNPEIANLIRDLRYSPGILDHESPTFHASMASMVRLRSLAVYRYQVFEINNTQDDQFRWNNHPVQDTLLHLLRLPSLQSFRICCVYDFCVSDLASCASLRELVVDRSSSYSHTTLAHRFSSNLPPDPVRLRSLTFQYNTFKMLHDIATLHRPDGKPVVGLESLENLTLDLASFHPSAQLFFARCTSLDVVHLLLSASVSGMPNLANLLHPVKTSLRQIHLNLSVNEETPDLLFGLPSLLQQMRASNKLEEIGIQLCIKGSVSDAADQSWNLFDEVLAGPGWDFLTNVILNIEVTGYSIQHDNGWLQEELENLPERQLLRLHANESIKFDFNLEIEEYCPYSW